MNSIKIWETIRSKNANCSLPVAVRVSKTRVLKLPTAIKEGGLIGSCFKRLTGFWFSSTTFSFLLFFFSSLVPGGKMRDPGNEVAYAAGRRLRFV